MLFWYQILKFILFDMRNERDSVVVGIVWCWRSIACFRLLASLPYMSICTRYIILLKAAALFIRYKISKLIPFCCLCLIKALTTPCMHCRHAAIWIFYAVTILQTGTGFSLFVHNDLRLCAIASIFTYK